MRVPELSDPIPEPMTSVGKILAERRGAWEMTVQEVASSLNLGVDTIEALESDDYCRLPGTTFVKGYIRSYAKLLKLDVEDLMEHISLQPERITEIPATRATLKRKGKTRTREKTSGGGFLKVFFALLLVGVVIAIGFAQLPRLGISQLSELLEIGQGQTQQADSNQLVIPNDESEGVPQGALIPIE